MALTGKFQFRKTAWGKVVLQVEEEVKPLWRRSKPGPVKRRWRDARLMDLAAPEMRHLIDIGRKARLWSQSSPASHLTSPQQKQDEAQAAPKTQASPSPEAAQQSADPSTATPHPYQGPQVTADHRDAGAKAPQPKQRSRARRQKAGHFVNGQSPSNR